MRGSRPTIRGLIEGEAAPAWTRGTVFRTDKEGQQIKNEENIKLASLLETETPPLPHTPETLSSTSVCFGISVLPVKTGKKCGHMTQKEDGKEVCVSLIQPKHQYSSFLVINSLL